MGGSGYERFRIATFGFPFIFLEGKTMEFRSKKIPKNLDSPSTIANNMVIQAVAKKICLVSGVNATANGAGADSDKVIAFSSCPDKWRVVGIGAYVVAGGASTILESVLWGYLVSDIGAEDKDAFGSIVCVVTANKELVAGDIIYQGIAPFDNFLGVDALANAGAHTWDISGAGAGVSMGVWQSKAAILSVTKANVASSTATVIPFVLIEYDTGAGLT